MKLKIFLIFCLCLGMVGCQNRLGERFLWHAEEPEKTQEKTLVRAAVLLPLTGKSAKIGESFQNSAMMALQEQPNSPLELLFFDTEGTADGTEEAWRHARGTKPDIIIGPVFATEVAALKSEAPGVPILSFTTDNTLMEKNVYSMGVLIPSQVERLVQFMCAAGHQKVAVLGPEDKTGELTMNVLSEAVQRCPGMQVERVSLYEPSTTNFAPAVLKIVPKPIDPKKKNLTEEEKIELDKPMAERIAFDSLFIFEDGVRLQQLVSLLSYYDVTPTVVPFYGLANWQSVKDRSLAGGYFTAMPVKRINQFNHRYRALFGEEPPRISSLAYDAVSLAAFLAERGRLNEAYLTQQEGFNGVNGRFRLRSDGSNDRLLEVFQLQPNRQFISVSPVPDDFVEPDSSFEAPIRMEEETGYSPEPGGAME